MQVAIVTVGDELLAGTTTNTNATWLAEELTSRGSTVERILTIPDDHALIADYVDRWSDAFDAVVVTGGLGGTPDDVTMEAVADGLDRDLLVFDRIRDRLLEKAADFRENHPNLVDKYDLELDADAAATLPVGATPIVTDAGWAPGSVVENAYVFPGVPEEMKAAFDRVADEFHGDAVARTIDTPAPEGALYDVLEGVTDAFDVTVGSYPSNGDRPGRVRVRGTHEETVEAATDWLRERVETAQSPETERMGENQR